MSAVNPFEGLNADAMTAVGRLLEIARRSDEYDTSYDEIEGLIASWRAARGDDAFEDWRWWIGEVDGESYALDFLTREGAIAAAPKAIERGDVYSEDGRYWIIEARVWDDTLDEGKDIFPFADRRNHETLSIKAGA